MRVVRAVVCVERLGVLDLLDVLRYAVGGEKVTVGGATATYNVAIEGFKPSVTLKRPRAFPSRARDTVPNLGSSPDQAWVPGR